MKIWIEQDFCTGDGLCADLCPEVFAMGATDGLAYVRPEAAVPGPSGELGGPRFTVSDEFEAGVLDAQAQCAGECIFVSR